MECRLCGSTRFRLSRLRVPDLFELIFLRHPVRCRICYKREYVSLFTAFGIRRANKRRHEEERRRKKMQQANPARPA
jgi:hypothetical protein